MNADLSVIRLIGEASLLVQLVMLSLLLVSLVSWTMIFERWKSLKAARSAADGFEDLFWSGADLTGLYQEIGRKDYPDHGMESIFEAGFTEFLRLRKQGEADPLTVVAGAQRSMRAALSRSGEALEHHLSFLATVGSISPYVGLFGTVWGIMNSFMSLGVAQQATIASVAPGIAEALIATAMGLFAAIPAVVAYNRYAHDAERLANRYENFMEEFSNLLQRQIQRG